MKDTIVFNPTEADEQAWLVEIASRIEQGMKETGELFREQSADIQELKAYMWENRAEIDSAEKLSLRKSIAQVALAGDKMMDYKGRMARLLESPWFGRIDFCYKGATSSEPFYIGVHAFFDRTTNESLIHDWRAPISGLFYDSESGDASFEAPSGLIKGKITLKRQYRIRQGRMEFMLESALRIHDDILQQELSRSSGERMKNIVTTIQREQNAIIRNVSHETLIIQGVAGSGKTSIALHRIAFLLYKFKETISSEEILIISPHKVFADYISNVLPELGEERIIDTGMEDIGLKILDHRYRFRSFQEQISLLLEKPDAGFQERIQFKASAPFANRMDEYLVYLENTLFTPADIFFKRYPVPDWFIKERFESLHRLPLLKRIPEMVKEICSNILFYYKYEVTTPEKADLTKSVSAMFRDTNLRSLYKGFYAWIGRPELLKMTKGSVFEHADLFPMAYLKIRLEGNKPNERVKHLVIDEMQDYTPLHYRVINRLFLCNKTILGDLNQSLNPLATTDAETIQKALPRAEVMKMTRSYRSTYEIASLALRILPGTEMDIVKRHGTPPSMVSLKTKAEEIASTEKLIAEFREGHHHTLGVLFKTIGQAEKMFGAMKNHDNLHFLDTTSATFTGGIIFTSIHMAKGLEFDHVILPHANEYQPQSSIDRHMLYIGVTRAMHRLHLLHTGPLNIILQP